MQTTILVENKAGRSDLRSEHGLAIWIETGANNILFDTGASDAVIENARHLEIDLSTADAIVLSHAHYDHTGGLAAVAHVAPGAAIFMGRNATTPKYSRRDDGLHEIGLDHQTMNAIAHRVRVAEDGQALVPGVTVLADFPADSPLPADNNRLLVRGGEGMMPDPFIDEIALLIDTGSGPVLISGCSHRGIGNIVTKATARAGRLAAVIGGFHLHKETDERIVETAEALRDLPRIHAAHCTGDHAVELLKSRLGEKVLCFHGGSVITID
jgi:7,8-dihydropterin-6-yl-methyl-4-(beta-D-ribofuranosyl)aminobenzene 5'-phosphate synthase